MSIEAFQGVMIPFLGTVLGSSMVFFAKGEMNRQVQRALTGFAAGVMTAASVWSLLIPAMNHAEDMGKLAFIPAAVGFWIGILFLLILDRSVPHMHMNSCEAEGPKCSMKKSSMLVLAVTLHNLPEGMAVGVVIAGWLSGDSLVPVSAVMALSLGIAIQNFPEGAIISMPLYSQGMSRGKAFLYGSLSGVVEPVGAMLTILAAGLVTPLLPYLLSFAAGAMIYVVVEELIPEMSEENIPMPERCFCGGLRPHDDS
ncbi:MAG: ZIP family metal transporter [Anaerovoracaceae bacterium]